MRAVAITMFLLALSISLMAGADTQPNIKTVKEFVKTDGAATEEITRRWIYLENGCVLNMTTRNEERKNSLVSKWGDVAFGLKMGKIWNGWDFLGVSLKTPKGKVSPISAFPPSSIWLLPCDTAWLAEIKWPLSQEGQGTLSLSVFQFPSHKNWLFFRLKTTGDAEIEKVVLSCYPATSHWAKDVPERERMAATRESVCNASKNDHEFAPQSPGMILYNNYIHTNDGCMIVLDNGAVQKIKIAKTSNSIGPQIFLKPGSKSMSFALGFFMDSPAEKESVIFLRETQDSISSFLKDIDWTPKISVGKVEKLAGSLKKIFEEAEKMGIQADKKAMEEAEKLHASLSAAVKSGDTDAFWEDIQKLEGLKRKIVEDLLNNYK